MKTLLKYLSPYKVRMTVGLIIKIVGSVMDLFLPLILSFIIDDIIPTKNIRAVVFWGGVMILCSGTAWVTNVVANRMASRVAGDATRSLRHDLFEKISYLDAASVDKLTISSLESRITSDSYSVHGMIGMVQRLGVRAPTLLVGGLIVAGVLDLRLTAVLAFTVPFIFASVFYISKKGVLLYRSLQTAIDSIVTVVRENATGVRVIKALGKTPYEKRRFDAANRKATTLEKRAGTVMSLTNPLISFFLNLGLCAVILVGASLVDTGLSTNGKIVAFLSYFTIISNATISLSRIFTASSKGLAGMARIERVLSEEPTLWTAAYADETPVKKVGQKVPHIEFRDVSFSYDAKGEHRVLSHVSFSVDHGETLGMMGATGSGKSTVILLLLRMYDPDEGEILIDGVNIKNISSEALRARFGVVFQNDFLFADSIFENVDFGRGLSEKQVDAALEKAQAASFVSSYEDGKAHMLDIKGANLSGGQKQRLLIARAIAADPEILILDDSSSALDYKTDARLREVIRTALSGTTSILIAQRVSAIMHAERILVFDGGKILASGTHDTLIQTCDTYREIAHIQLSGGDLLD